MKDCILVTGGAGFIGSAISVPLKAFGLPVVVVDNLHPQVHGDCSRPRSLPERVTFHRADTCDADAWRSFTSEWRPEIVFHLAAETGTAQSLAQASRHAMVNVVGTTRMLDAFAAAQVVPARFVLASSRAVYGEGAWADSNGIRFYPGQRSAQMLENGQWDFPGAHALPVEADSTIPHPVSVYGATKLAQEHVLRVWARSFGSALSICRFQNVYGPGQSLDNPYTGIVPLFSKRAKAGRSIPLFEDGHMLRDFVFVDDVVEALLAAAMRADAAGRVFDIGSGVNTTICDVAEAIAHQYGAPEPHVCGSYRLGDVRHTSCVIDAARTIGWSPRVGLQEGLRRLCNWIDRAAVG